MKKRLVLALIWPLLVLACGYVLLRYWLALAQNEQKAFDIAYALDEAANVGLNGAVNTTISARAGRASIRGRKWGCWLCDVLDWLQPGHCANAMKDRAP